MVTNKRSEDLENHLHQQYAENDNSRIGLFISFIVGLAGLFSFYGFVFINTKTRDTWNFSIIEYSLMTFVVIGMSFFLALLALYFGYSTRRDHFIVHNIRKKRFTKAQMELVFGEAYYPFDKGYYNFLPDVYNLFFWLFFSFAVFLHLATYIKFFQIKMLASYSFNKMLFGVTSVSLLVFISLFLVMRKFYYNKYKKLNCKN
jgi:hypothetical protein